MSTARKMRRKLNRALPGADVETVQKTLTAMQVAAEEQTADRIYKKLRRDIQKPSEAYATGVADAFASVIGFLRDGGLGKPFGATRLERFVEGFVMYQDGLHDGSLKWMTYPSYRKRIQQRDHKIGVLELVDIGEENDHAEKWRGIH